MYDYIFGGKIPSFLTKEGDTIKEILKIIPSNLPHHVSFFDVHKLGYIRISFVPY